MSLTDKEDEHAARTVILSLRRCSISVACRILYNFSVELLQASVRCHFFHITTWQENHHLKIDRLDFFCYTLCNTGSVFTITHVTHARHNLLQSCQIVIREADILQAKNNTGTHLQIEWTQSTRVRLFLNRVFYRHWELSGIIASGNRGNHVAHYLPTCIF